MSLRLTLRFIVSFQRASARVVVQHRGAGASVHLVGRRVVAARPPGCVRVLHPVCVW